MRTAPLVLAAALVLVPASSAQVGVEFDEPASANGELTLDGLQWGILRIPPGQAFTLDVPISSPLIVTNVVHAGRVGTPLTGSEGAVRSFEDEQDIAAGSYELTARTDGGTIAFLVEPMHAELNGSTSLLELPSGSIPPSLSENPSTDATFSPWMHSIPKQVALLSDNPQAPTRLALDVPAKAIEWYNFDVGCPSQTSCPSGGGRETQREGAAGIFAENEFDRFERTTAPAMLHFDGFANRAVLGGQALALGVGGSLRLPNAAVSCADCLTIEDKAILAIGEFRLTGLQSANGRFSGQIDGEFSHVRVNEAWVDASVLGGTASAAGAAVGIGLILKLLAAPLFTRLSKEKALEHPRRKAIFEYVQQHPGANFREVARKTGIAAGTVRHHLTILERAGHLVEKPHNGTVRLFENHGKFDHNWSDVVLLREPVLATIHEWLAGNPQSPQKDILEAMELLGWSRSTTQHRLARLVDGGMVNIRLQGRLKIYSVVERPSVRSTGKVGFPAAPTSPI